MRVGTDTMTGYGGNDIYFVGDAGDLVIETANDGYDTVAWGICPERCTLNYSYTLPDHVERVVAQAFGTFALTGNALDNEVTGNNQGNVIDGKLHRHSVREWRHRYLRVHDNDLGGGNIDQIVDFSAGFEKNPARRSR